MIYTAQDCVNEGFVESLDAFNTMIVDGFVSSRDSLPDQFKTWDYLGGNETQETVTLVFSGTETLTPTQEKQEYINEF